MVDSHERFSSPFAAPCATLSGASTSASETPPLITYRFWRRKALARMPAGGRHTMASLGASTGSTSWRPTPGWANPNSASKKLRSSSVACENAIFCAKSHASKPSLERCERREARSQATGERRSRVVWGEAHPQGCCYAAARRTAQRWPWGGLAGL